MAVADRSLAHMHLLIPPYRSTGRERESISPLMDVEGDGRRTECSRALSRIAGYATR